MLLRVWCMLGRILGCGRPEDVGGMESLVLRVVIVGSLVVLVVNRLILTDRIHPIV
jgi:hypothetical protein